MTVVALVNRLQPEFNVYVETLLDSLAITSVRFIATMQKAGNNLK